MARLLRKFLSALIAIGIFSGAGWPDESIATEQLTNASFCTTPEIIKTIQDAEKCQYSNQPLPTELNLTHKTKWVKVETPNNSESKNLVISIEPFLLDTVDIYYKSGSEWKKISTGASKELNPELAAIAGYRVTVPAPEKQKNTYYIATRSPSLTFLSIHVSNEKDYSGLLIQNISFGLQLGILVAILFFSLISYVLNRSSVMKRFSIFSFNLLLCLVLGSGLAMQTLLPNAPNLNAVVFHSLLCLRIALWVWVMRALMAQYKIPEWHLNSCYIIYGLVALDIAIYPLVGMTFISSLVGLLYFIAPLIQIYAVQKTSDIPTPFKAILTWGFLITSGLFLLTVLSLITPLEITNRTPLYIARLTDFTGPLVLLGIITYRNRLVHKELEDVKTALSEATLRAEYEKKLLSDRQTLIDMFAHELKNPLTSISLAVDNLSDNQEKISLSDNKRIANINRSIKDMDEIIERCNLMNSLDNKEVILEKNEIPLNRFIQEILEDQDEDKRIEINTSNQLTVTTDAKFLRIIFTNLIQNALKYSVINSKINISSSKNQRSISIRFSNEVNASMMPNETLIFTRFYRHPLAHGSRGAGLGLFLTKEMCKMLGGNITYASSSGIINFTVEIPKL